MKAQRIEGAVALVTGANRGIDEHIRGQFQEQGVVDAVERLAGPQPLADERIDLAARAADVECRCAAGWKPPHPRRRIALVRSADQTIAGSQSAD